MATNGHVSETDVLHQISKTASSIRKKVLIFSICCLSYMTLLLSNLCKCISLQFFKIDKGINMIFHTLCKQLSAIITC